MADVCITINGQPTAVPEGTTVAAALMQNSGAFRVSATGQARAPLCGMGICFECRVTLDGESQRLSCQTPCTPGMEIESGARSASKGGPCLHCGLKEDQEIVIVGAGPAGLAAAVAAAPRRRVLVLDDNPSWGGQIWRGEAARPSQPWAHDLYKQAAQAGAEFLTGARVFAQMQPNRLLIEDASGCKAITYERLVLATGARERFLPFPGWTLPGVMGAGGLQALVKGGMPIAGKTVIVAGSGPLLLAVASYLKKRGTVVRLVAEQAPFRQVARFAAGLLLDFDKGLQALGMRWQLRGVPYRLGCWPTEAHGNDRVTAVTLTNGRRTWRESCDYLACGFGLVPNVELPLLLGCRVARGAVVVNEFQETSVAGIYCAGEAIGIGGLDCALNEGRAAGLAAVGQPVPRSSIYRSFARNLEKTFALRDELKALPRHDTLICRCEDVALKQLEPYQDWRSAKLQTRCGMGPCQGRVCGPALAFLRGWDVESIRPPVMPVRVESLDERGTLVP